MQHFNGGKPARRTDLIIRSLIGVHVGKFGPIEFGTLPMVAGLGVSKQLPNGVRYMLSQD